MKAQRLTTAVLALALATSIATTPIAQAVSKKEVTAVQSGTVNIMYNGTEQRFTDEHGSTVLPLIYNGTTYLPVRAMANLVGFGVGWDGEHYEVVLTSDGDARTYNGDVEGADKDVQVLLCPDITISLDGVEQTFTDANGQVVYPLSYKGTTYLPVRAVSGLVDLPVEWDNSSRTVLLGETEEPVTPSAGIEGIVPIPADAILPQPGQILDKGNGASHVMSSEECVEWGVSNGVIFDETRNLSTVSSVSFRKLEGKYSTVTFTVIAPKDSSIELSVGYGPSIYEKDGIEYFELKAGQVETFTVSITNAKVAGIVLNTSGSSKYVVGNIYFK